jgi:hypothetical protein
VTMLASERETGFCVVEVLTVNACGLPADGGVAPSTFRSKAALVLVFMAGAAAWGKAQPGAIEIFCGQECALRYGDVLRVVAGTAADTLMFTIERVSGLCMIESLGCRIPVHHLEIGAVVIGVALDARSTG